MNNSCENLRKYYKNNDTDALGAFFKEHLDFTFRIALYFSKNRSDAEDIVQQIYLSILKSKTPCEGIFENDPQKVKGWLAIVAANNAKMFIRKKISNRRIMDKNKEIETTRQKSSNMQNKNQTYIELNEALNSLPSKHRTAILMHYKEGFTFTEIAETLELKSSSVRSLISRGLEKVRKVLVANGITLSVGGILSTLKSQPLEAAPTYLFDKCIQISRSSTRLGITTTKTHGLIHILWIAALAISMPSFYYFYIYQNPNNIAIKTYLDKNTRPIITTDKISKPIRYHQIWDFDENNIDNIKIIQGDWKFDKKLGAMNYINKDEPLIFSIMQSYNRPILLKYKGFALIQKDQYFKASFGLLLSKGNEILYPQKSYNTLFDQLDIYPNQKKKLEGISLLIGQYLIIGHPNNKKYGIIKYELPILELIKKNICVTFNQIYIEELEIEELEILDLKELITTLKNQLKLAMKKEDFEECFQAIDKTFNELKFTEKK